MLYALEDVPADLEQVGGVAIGGVADVYAARPKKCGCACVQRGQTAMGAVQNMEGCDIAMKHGRRRQSMQAKSTTADLLVGRKQHHPCLVVEVSTGVVAAAHC